MPLYIYRLEIYVSNQGLGNSSQPLTPPATKPKGREVIHYRRGSTTPHKEMTIFPLNQVYNAVEDYGLFPRPWFEIVDEPIVAAHENQQLPRAVLTITLGDGALPAAFGGGQIKCRCSEEATGCLCSEGAGRWWAECLVNGLRIDWQDVSSSSERVQLDYCHARHPQCRYTYATVTPSRSTYNTSAVTRLPR